MATGRLESGGARGRGAGGGGRAAAPEHELLRLVARARDARAYGERARALVERGVDWPLVLMTALEHGVMPLLHRNFFTLGPGAAPDVFARDLRALYLANEYRNLSLTSELVRVLALFEAEGVPALAYGGPVLAAAAYGDTALRQSSPLDVLVGRADLGRAASLLAGAGYSAAERLTPRQVRAQVGHAGALAFAGPDPEVALRVRWRFAPEWLRGGPDPRTALENRRREPFAGAAAPVLDPDDALFVLVVEGALGGWRRLAMVCDVSELLSSRGDWEWPGLLDRARAEGSLRMLLLGAALAAELLWAPVPGEVLAQAARKPSVEALRRQAVARLAGPGPRALSRAATLLFESRTIDDAGPRLAHAWRRSFIPTSADWRWLPLPDAAYPLYYLVRPLRLAVSEATLAWRRREHG